MNDIAKHLTPFLEHSPSRVPFLGLLIIGLLTVLLRSPNQEVVNSKPLQHSLSHIGFLIQVSLGNKQDIPTCGLQTRPHSYQLSATQPWGPSLSVLWGCINNSMLAAFFFFFWHVSDLHYVIWNESNSMYYKNIKSQTNANISAISLPWLTTIHILLNSFSTNNTENE